MGHVLQRPFCVYGPTKIYINDTRRAGSRRALGCVTLPRARAGLWCKLSACGGRCRPSTQLPEMAARLLKVAARLPKMAARLPKMAAHLPKMAVLRGVSRESLTFVGRPQGTDASSDPGADAAARPLARAAVARARAARAAKGVLSRRHKKARSEERPKARRLPSAAEILPWVVASLAVSYAMAMHFKIIGS